VSTAPTLGARGAAPIHQAISMFLAYPFHFVALQIPELSVEFLQIAIGDKPTNRLLVIILIVLPYFCIATYLSRSLTYVSARQALVGKPSFSTSMRVVCALWRTLIPVSLLTGILILCGFALFVVPAIYFLTVYLFVPALLITEPSSPWSSYLYKSKRLVGMAFPKTLLVVVMMMSLSAILEFDVGRDWLHSILPPGFPHSITYCTKLIAMAILGAICSLWISYHFESLRLGYDEADR